MEVRIWRCNMHVWIFLTSHPFLWCIVWFCESLNQSNRSYPSSCLHAVGLIFPFPFLCLLVNWSRKLKQQKHCNLANIFADSTNTTGWLLAWVKPQWRCKAERETVAGGGLDCCTLGGFICFFNLCCLGFALLLCVWGHTVTVIWCKTSTMECVGFALAVLTYVFCLSCSGNNVWPYEEPGENSNKWKLLLGKATISKLY